MATNYSQSLGDKSSQYGLAIENAKTLRDAVHAVGGKLSFTGHSLGGGLASAASMATGLDANTFNASGLSRGTIKNYRLGGGGRINAYYNRSDILSFIQDYTPLPNAAGNKIPIAATGWHGMSGVCTGLGTRC